jgi:hypothetical protein
VRGLHAPRSGQDDRRLENAVGRTVRGFFLAVPRDNWVENLHGYLDFADAHFAAHGFRCNLPLGSYFVRHDQNSLFPLLNQSPGVTREQTAAAYGPRWKTFSDWVRSVDPQGRLRNPFFDELLVS